MNPLSQRKKRMLAILFFISPMFLIYTVFAIIPGLFSVFAGFTEWRGSNILQLKFTGLANYTRILQDRTYAVALRNTLLFLVFTLTAQFGLAFILAVLLQKDNRVSGFFRGLFFLPQVLSLVVVGLLFSFFLSPSMGLITQFLDKIGVELAKPLLLDKRVAIWLLIFVRGWREFGFSMFLFIARLQAIPQSVYEAADIDGVGPLGKLWFITIPMLKEVAIVVVILSGSSAFRAFDIIWIITAGGPFHATQSLVTYTYYKAFVQFDMGYGSTVATTLAGIVFIFTVILLYVSKAGTRKY